MVINPSPTAIPVNADPATRLTQGPRAGRTAIVKQAAFRNHRASGSRAGQDKEIDMNDHSYEEIAADQVLTVEEGVEIQQRIAALRGLKQWLSRTRVDLWPGK
jgi:hypothetical protein